MVCHLLLAAEVTVDILAETDEDLLNTRLGTQSGGPDHAVVDGDLAPAEDGVAVLGGDGLEDLSHLRSIAVIDRKEELADAEFALLWQLGEHLLVGHAVEEVKGDGAEDPGTIACGGGQSMGNTR